MGQNDSRHKNLPPGYQNYDPQMINNYLAYQQQLNPNFFMQGAYQTRVFPEGARLRQGFLFKNDIQNFKIIISNLRQ